MVIRLFLGLLLLVVIMGFTNWYSSRATPAQRSQFLRQLALYGGAAALLVLVATGRLPWLFALIGGALAAGQRILTLLRSWQWLKSLHASTFSGTTSRTANDQVSTFVSRFLHMQLNHGSGQLSGQVREGRFAGCDLDQLQQSELLVLLKELNVDAESAELLQTYLERRFGENWAPEDHEQMPHPRGADMTVQTAYEVLGLAEDADRNTIIMAHRRLMQKLHPDHGGSSYLASRVNQARDVLLQQLGEA